MRILHLIKRFNFGGAENYVRELANVMDSMGNNVFVIAKSGQQVGMLNRSVKFLNLRMNDFLIPLNIFRVVYIVRKYKIEILHGHQRLPVLIGSIAGKITGIPIVVTIHGQTKYDLRSKLSKKIPAKFIFVGQGTYNNSSKYGIPGHKSVIIQNGVSIFTSAKPKDNYSVCYISRIDKKHSSVISLILQKVIISIFSDYPNLTFNIIGDGGYLNELRHEAEIINSQLNREVVFIHGYIQDVKGIIQKAGLVLGVGRVAIESLACGVPLLSVNQRYFGGLVNQENYPFFKINNFVSYGSDPPAEAELLSSFRDYFDNISFWQKEASNLQKNIDKDFNINRITESIIDLYRNTKDRKKENSPHSGK